MRSGTPVAAAPAMSARNLRRVWAAAVSLLAVSFCACTLMTPLDGLRATDGGPTEEDSGSPDVTSDGMADAVSEGNVDAGPAAQWVDVSVGYGHVCALASTGEVYCWGSNSEFQAGGTVAGPMTLPAKVAGISDAVAISAGRLHTCAIRKDGSVACWGHNAYGALGVPDTKLSHLAATSTPMTVEGLSGPAKRVSADDFFTCVVRTDQQLWCFGSAVSSCEDSVDAGGAPRRVRSASTFTSVAVGRHHSCGGTAPQGISCWGKSLAGETLVPGSSTPSCSSGSTYTGSVGVGYTHSCAFYSNGLWCWGSNGRAQLGAAADGGQSETPVRITKWASSPTSKFDCGGDTTCAITANKTVECFGRNDSNNLGNDDPNRSDSADPVKVNGVSEADVISVGPQNACVIERIGTGPGVVLCWGANGSGQLGTGETSESGGGVPVKLPQP